MFDETKDNNMESFQLSFGKKSPSIVATTPATGVHVSKGHLPMMLRLFSRISANDLHWLTTIPTMELLALVELIHTAKERRLDLHTFYHVHNQRCTRPELLSEMQKAAYPALQARYMINEGLFPIAQRLCRRGSRHDLHWLNAMDTAELTQILRLLQIAKRETIELEKLVDVHNQTCVKQRASSS